MDYAIYTFLYHLCGESNEVVRDTKITEIGPNEYHLVYDKPCEEIDLKVRVTQLSKSGAAALHYKYEVYDSKFDDDGTVQLMLFCN